MLMAIFEEAMNEVALGDEQASFEWEAVFGPGGGCYHSLPSRRTHLFPSH